MHSPIIGSPSTPSVMLAHHLRGRRCWRIALDSFGDAGASPAGQAMLAHRPAGALWGDFVVTVADLV
jgi:hypothetical protein